MSDVAPFIQEIAKTSQDIWQKGWAEANGGNISVRLTPEKMQGAPPMKPKGDWIPVGVTLPALAGEKILVTGTTRFLRNIALFPEKNVGVIELDAAGSAYRVLWGFEPSGRPTSELAAHLGAHAAIKAASNDAKRAVIHTHATHLIALSYRLNLDTARLTKLLWQCHAECVVGFPAGVEFLPWMMAGSPEIAAATARALEKRPLVIWQYHGVFGAGRNLDEAFGLIDMANNAARIYLTVMAAGGFAGKLTTEQVRAIAANFKVTPDAAALGSDTEPFFGR